MLIFELNKDEISLFLREWDKTKIPFKPMHLVEWNGNQLKLSDAQFQCFMIKRIIVERFKDLIELNHSDIVTLGINAIGRLYFIKIDLPDPDKKILAKMICISSASIEEFDATLPVVMENISLC